MSSNNPNASVNATTGSDATPRTGIERPERKDWGRARRTLHSFRRIPRIERIRIWIRGYLDGKRGQVTLAGDGTVVSPYCSEMLQAANKRAVAEWLNCDGDVSELRPYLDQQAHEYDVLKAELEGLAAKREDAASAAEGRQLEGDAHVSASVAAKRRAARAAKAAAPIAARRSRIIERLDEIQAETAEPLADYEERESIAVSHELVIAHELAERAAVYVRGASRHLGANPGEVRAPEPTSVPRENHYLQYRRYDFDAHTADAGA